MEEFRRLIRKVSDLLGEKLKQIGIDLVPLDEPIKCRFQEVSAIIWFFITAFGTTIGYLCFFILLFTPLRYLMIIYYMTIRLKSEEIHSNHTRRSERFRKWIVWKYAADYFSMQLKAPGVVLEAKKNYLFCCFPHGIIPAGTFFTFATNYGHFSQLFPHHTPSLLVLKSGFDAPFMRKIVSWSGSFSTEVKTMYRLLTAPGGGNALGISVGGVPESMLSYPGEYSIYLKKRLGFIKMALKTGTPLVPVFSFGDTDIFRVVRFPKGCGMFNFQQTIVNKLQFGFPIIYGRGFFQNNFGFMPLKVPINVVVGKPLDVIQIEEPTKEDISKLHSEFTEKLIELFETHKYNYVKDPQNTKLIIT